MLAALMILTMAAAWAEGGYTAIRDTYAAEAGWGEPLLTEAMPLENSEEVRLVFFLGDGVCALYGGGECSAWAMDYRTQLANMYILCTSFDAFSLLCDGHFTLAWVFGQAAEGVITTAEEAAEYAEAILPMLEASETAP